MELQKGLQRLEAFHGNNIPNGTTARLKALMGKLAAKRGRPQDGDEAEDEREDGSKRPKMSGNRLFYNTLRKANSDDFWIAYFGATKEQQTLAESKILPRRDEIKVETYQQVIALEKALDLYDADTRGIFRVEQFSMIPFYKEVKEIREAEVMAIRPGPSGAFVRCLLKLLAVSNLSHLTLEWVHLEMGIFELLMDHTALRTLELGNGVSADTSFDLGAWLEVMSVVDLHAPIRFSPKTLLATRLSNPDFVRQIRSIRPWLLGPTGKSRTFPSVRYLALVELDTHHEEELYGRNMSDLPLDDLRDHEDVIAHISSAFPRLRECQYDVSPSNQSKEVRVLTQTQAEIFPAKCKDVFLSLRAANTIIEHDRNTVMIGTDRRVKKLALFETAFDAGMEVDGAGLAQSFSRVKDITVPRLSVISNTLKDVSGYYWRTIKELPIWLREKNLESDALQTATGTYVDYDVKSRVYKPREAVNAAILKSSRTRKLFLSALVETTENRSLSMPTVLPKNLQTLVCVNDVWFAEKLIESMNDETKESLRNVWLHRMQPEKKDEELNQVQWIIEPDPLSDGFSSAALDRLHPDARINGLPISVIKKKDAMVTV